MRLKQGHLGAILMLHWAVEGKESGRPDLGFLYTAAEGHLGGFRV